MNYSKKLGRIDFWKDTLKYLPAIAATALVGILILPILTRLFTTHSFGNYSLAFASLMTLQVAVNMWLTSSIIRFFAGAERESSTQELVSTAFFMTLAGSMIIASVFLFFIFFIRRVLDPELFQLLMIVPLHMIAYNLISLPLQILRARRKIGLFNLLNIIRLIFPPAAGIILSIYLGRNIVGYMAGSSILLIFLIPISYALFFKAEERPKIKYFNTSWAKTLLSFGVPLIPLALMEKVLEMSDRLIIGVFRGSVETGLYTANYMVASMPIQLIILVMTSAAAPVIVSIYENQTQLDCEEFLAFIGKIFIKLGIPILFGLSILSKDIVLLLSTKEYIKGVVVVPIVAGGTFLLGLQWITQRGMILANKTKRILVFFLTAGTFNLIANFAFVPVFGFVAAAWTTLFSNLLLLVLVFLGSAPFLTLRIPFKSLFFSIIASCIMTFGIYLFPKLPTEILIINLITKITFGTIIYGLTMLIFGEIGHPRIMRSQPARNDGQEDSG